MVKSKLFFIVFLKVGLSLCMMSAPLIVSAAKIEVTVDRNPVTEDESFTIQYQVNGGADDDPDFLPLEKDFKILNRSQSQNIQFINGRLNRQSTWTLSLLPRRPGKFLIPSINFGTDVSDSLQLTVNSAIFAQAEDRPKNLYIEVEATPKNPYVQSQVLYTIRIYHTSSLNLLNASLSEVKISQHSAVIERLEDETSYEKRLNGVRYKVFEKTYAIFPQQSGELVIDPVVLETQYVSRRRSLRTKRVRSKELTLNVQAKPANISTKALNNWLPAKHLQIKDEWPSGTDKLKVGEPVTRTITIMANGLTDAQIPEISIPENPRFKQYPDQPVLENRRSNTGIIGIRQEKLAIVPTQAGPIELPAIEIPWWNTRKNKLEIAKVEKRMINVMASSLQNAGKHPFSSTTEENTDKRDVSDVKLRQSDRGRSEDSGYWYWLSVALIIGWSLTLVTWWLSGRRRHPDTTANIPIIHRDCGILRKKIINACKENDPRIAKVTLLEWARCHWFDDNLLSLGDIAKKGDKALSEEILKLNEVLYSSKRSNWDGASMKRIIENLPKRVVKESEARANGIAPLHLTIHNKAT